MRALKLSAAAGLIVLGLAGCATPNTNEAFCNEYAAAWNEMTAARDSPTRTDATFVPARASMLDRWEALSKDESAPEDVRKVVAMNVDLFTSAVSGTGTTADTTAAYQKFQVSHDALLKQCKDDGFSPDIDE
ncbi:hypothetical protein [Plantibacter sp. YIM 135249]|uniref:hypothetical protein n=1 Tax=Plantibacter sp. YIM 135249 TaxID=3423918 RepID=UPI003D344EFE